MYFPNTNFPSVLQAIYNRSEGSAEASASIEGKKVPIAYFRYEHSRNNADYR